MKLNLGCGTDLLEGFVNVDRWGKVDVTHDLESLPWPWVDDYVEEVRLFHVLEHLGKETRVFMGIVRELYRVCRNDALVHVAVPHHRHDSFYADPTHVRPITEETFRLLSRRQNLAYRANGDANSCLALEWMVDFELQDVKYHFDPRWQGRLTSGAISADELFEAALDRWNVIESVEMVVRVIKNGLETSPASSL